MTNGHVKSLLISGTYFPPQVGGISHFMASIVSALGPGRVCCLTGVSASKGFLRKDFKPRVYRRPMAFGRSMPRQAVGWCTAMAEIMSKERPSIVQLATVYEASLGLWMNRVLKLPFVIYAHGNEILGAMQAEWNKPRLALQQADRVFANSRFTSDLVQRVGVDPKKIDIVHPGCDIDRFRPNEPRVDLRRKLLGPRYLDQIIITVGALVPRKGHDMVIRALRRLRQTIPNVTYVIVGDGPRRTQLEQLAEVVGVADRVVFTGKISDKDLLDTYALSDVFVMPSREELEKCDVEGFGLVFLEANACGKPVIGGRSGGSADAIIDGVTGLLVDPHDPEDIANAMQRVLSDRNLAIRLGRQGQLRVTSDFSWQQIASRVQQILDSIVNRDESRRMD